MSFTGGKLKLKGMDSGVKKKKSKKKDKNAKSPRAPADGDLSLEVSHDRQEDDATEPLKADRRTAAEKKYDEMQSKREADEIAKMASTSHKERIKDLNDYLSKLSEHHDIPRVGPG